MGSRTGIEKDVKELQREWSKEKRRNEKKFESTFEFTLATHRLDKP